MIEKLYGIELIKALSDAFGPSGCEDDVAKLIIEQLDGVIDGYSFDKVGNLAATVRGSGLNYNAESPRKVMLTAHMDEIGFMVKRIIEDGYLKFQFIGNVDSRAICGRRVVIRGRDGDSVGVVATKAIHMQSREERTQKTPADKLYFDIGAKDRDNAAEYAQVGSWATFDTHFEQLGEGGKYLVGKALSSRIGCAALIETARSIKENKINIPFDLYLTFTRCGEIGVSGAETTARRIKPDYCISVDGVLAADYPDVSEIRKICTLGGGVAVPFMDRQIIYDRKFIDFAMLTAGQNGVKVQDKLYPDDQLEAGKIHTAGPGIRTVSVQFPLRNKNSAECIADIGDYENLKSLLLGMMKAWKMV